MAYLIVEKGANKGASHELPDDGHVLVGRSKDADFQIKDRFVSRKHFEIEVEDGTFLLHDLNSDNGTFVNGEVVERRKLEDGAHLQIGETHLSFVSEESHQEREDLIGQTVGGHEILERIGRGGMGTVYRARQVSLDRVVALKILESELVEDEKFVEQFLSEARSAATLNHPNVTQVYDVGDDDGVYYLSMEYIRGGSLHDLLSERDILEPDRAAEIVLDIARALEFASRKELVHRDIKPGNIMLTEEGDAKLIDLGIAKQGMKGWEDEGMMVGTPDYMAPEQATDESVTTKADLYALGVTFYRMVTGERPIKGQSSDDVIKNKFEEKPIPPSSKNEDVPEWMSSLIMDMIRVNPSHRIASPDRVIDRIERGREESPSMMTVKGIKYLAKKRVRPRRWPLFVGGAVVLLLILGSTYFYSSLQTSSVETTVATGTDSGKDGTDAEKNGPSAEDRSGEEGDGETEDENGKEKEPARDLLDELERMRTAVEENPSEKTFQKAITKHQAFLDQFSDHEKKGLVTEKLNNLKQRKQAFLLERELEEIRSKFASLKSAFRKTSTATEKQIDSARQLLESGTEEVMGINELNSELNKLMKEEYSSVSSEKPEKLRQEMTDWYTNITGRLESFSEDLTAFSRALEQERFREAANVLSNLQEAPVVQNEPFRSALKEMRRRFREKERQFYHLKTDEIAEALIEDEFDRASELISSTRETVASTELRKKLAEEKEKIADRKERKKKQELSKRKKTERAKVFEAGAKRLVRMEARTFSPQEASVEDTKELKFDENKEYQRMFQFLTRQYRNFFKLLGDRAASFNHNIINDQELGQVEVSDATPSKAELDIPNVSATSDRSWNEFSMDTLLDFVYENKGDLTSDERTSLAVMFYLYEHVDGVSGEKLQTLLEEGDLTINGLSPETARQLLLRNHDRFQKFLIDTLIREAQNFLAKGRGEKAWNYGQFLRKRFREHSYFSTKEKVIKSLYQLLETYRESSENPRIESWSVYIRPHFEQFRNEHLPRIEELLTKLNFRMKYKRQGEVLLFLGRNEKAFSAFKKTLPENWLQQMKQGDFGGEEHRAQFYEHFYKSAVLSEQPDDVQSVLQNWAVQMYKAKGSTESQERAQSLGVWNSNLEEDKKSFEEEKFSFAGGTGEVDRLIRMKDLLGKSRIPNLKKKFVILGSILKEYPESEPVQSGDPLLNSAILLMNLGDFFGARQRFQKFIESYPDHSRVPEVSQEEGFLSKCNNKISFYSLH